MHIFNAIFAFYILHKWLCLLNAENYINNSSHIFIINIIYIYFYLVTCVGSLVSLGTYYSISLY